jgi:CheY-like chemotaxis protein
MATMPLPTSPKNGSERRRFPRFNMALDVTVTPLNPDQTTPSADAPREQTVSINLSLGGLCLYSANRYPVGSPLACSITLPGRATPVDVIATVAWFQKVDRESHSYKLGLEFTHVSPKDAAAIQSLCEHPSAADRSCAKRLLLVDDDTELQQALKLRFESSGFEVITASDGLEALRKGRTEHPHLIILDLMLPNLNGYEVCRLLKFDQKFRHIPIILVTARSRQEDLVMGQSVGADAYVTKPFDGKALIAKVEELITQPPR